MSAAFQNILIFIGLIGLAAFAYYLFVIQAQSDLAISQNSITDVESQQFLSQLNLLKGISLDTSIFSNDSFRSLVNQSVPVTPEPVGRSNPFSLGDENPL